MLLSHSSQSTSTRAGRPSSCGGCNCPPLTRNRCICKVFAKNTSAFPQFGHVRAKSSLRRFRVYPTPTGSWVKDLHIDVRERKKRGRGPRVDARLRLVTGLRPAGLEFEHD